MLLTLVRIICFLEYWIATTWLGPYVIRRPPLAGHQAVKHMFLWIIGYMDYGLLTMDYYGLDCVLWTKDYGLRTVEYGPWTMDHGLWTMDYGPIWSPLNAQ